MIRINLLPVRASRRQEQARRELLLVLTGAVCLLVLLGVVHISTASEIDEMEARVQQVRSEINQIKKDVSKVKDFGKQADQLQAKLEAIDRLKRNKIGPAKLLDDLATIVTAEKKIWLTSFVEKEGKLSLAGGALEHENISDFTVALEKRSAFFTNVNLTGVKAVSKDGVEYLEWTVTCDINYAAG